MNDQATLRTFIALELPDALHTAIRQTQSALEQRLAESMGSAWDERLLRWTRPEAAHLTLRFLGHTPADQLPALRQALTAALAPVAPFELQVGGLGCFPHTRRPQVIWVGIDGATDRLATLQAKVEQTVQTCGFATEAKPFRPHLTLARTARQAKTRQVSALGTALAALPAFAARVGDPFSIRAVIHFQSQLPGRGRGNPVYTPLVRIELDG
jgi:RNA 2',3'-cyclic 3'-phosphodiesterase